MITHLQIEGFKSFASGSPAIVLEPLNFLVGANGSGKSNVLAALRFLQLSVLQGTDAAVAHFRGAPEVRNRIERQHQESKPVALTIRCRDLGLSFEVPERGSVSLTSFCYRIEIDLQRPDGAPMILSENLSGKLTYESGATETYTLERDGLKVRLHDPSSKGLGPEFELLPHQATQSATGALAVSKPASLFRNFLGGWNFFHVLPDVARLPAGDGGEIKIGPNGENLAVVLHELEKRGNGALQSVIEQLKGVVPGFSSVKTIAIPVEGKRAFQVEEDRLSGSLNPHSVSDGTVRLLTLVVIAAWLAQKCTLVTLEEPENGLHPHLTKQIVGLLRDASAHCQFIVTTHQPDFLDHLEPEEVLLCDKKDGFTEFRRASEVLEVQRFKKTFTLGELWEQGALGGIP